MAIVTIECIKASAKSNLTFTQTKTINLTSRVVSCEGYKLQGKDVSEYVVGGRATICMDEETGHGLMGATEEIFAERANEDDSNPVLAIIVECSKITAASGGFIISGVTSIEINEHHEGEQDFESFIALAGAIKEDTQRASAEALERAALVKRQKRVELTSEAVQDQGLFAKAKNFLNSPVGGTKKVEEVAKPVAKPIIKRK